MKNVFIPHRWNNEDFNDISGLLDRTKFIVRNYSVPKVSPMDSIDYRYNVDPQIQKQIKYASFVVCSNRPANSGGIASEEIKFAVSIGKPVVAIKITQSTSTLITNLGISVISNRRDSLENWVAYAV
ncbi:hypothetical protein [Enterococcus sp. CWB-B31]|uniref:hypothetical protein n=1 Tax=Enterococcus sp. CWB-B31 TaxID=2885159 RepID=UPI001E5BEA1B|nr:hypothetical protein [Enterococcus sp. CWB-B31]MCB5956365.1 hypothetical protein [Enterococcus sp. CWB-B31]